MNVRCCLSLVLLSSLIVACGCGDDSGPVSPTNHAPVILPQNDTLVSLGDTLKLWASASDPDGNALKYRASVQLTLAELQQGYWPDACMDEHTGYYWFRPQVSDQPKRRFTFLVDDSRGGTDSTTFSVTVN